MFEKSLLDDPCSCLCHSGVTLLCMPCCNYTYEPRDQANAKAEIFRATQHMTRIGVVGYCPPTKFDEAEALSMINDAYDQVKRQFPKEEIAIVSGLTSVGVLKIAYEEAAKRGWYTVGVACKRASEHPLYLVNTRIIFGENWGDESAVFVGVLDAMIRIGVGKQSIRETETVRETGLPTFEYDLPVLS